MPEQAIVEIVFIDNKFVQLRIINPKNKDDTKWDLRDYAKNIFGNPDNMNADQKIWGTKDSDKLGLWVDKNNKYNVIYASYIEGKNSREKLEVTSSQHDALFEKIAVQQGKIIDDEMRENKLGIYSITN